MDPTLMEQKTNEDAKNILDIHTRYYVGTMKAVVQRVLNASVTVNGEIVSSIGRGLCVLIGISKNDTKKDLEYIAQKIVKLKLFDNDTEKRWSNSVKDKGYEILCISQFTLYYTLKSNKPDFHHAMPAEQAELFYKEFLMTLSGLYDPDKIKDGKFGALMEISLVNDGPVTIVLESPGEQQAGDS